MSWRQAQRHLSGTVRGPGGKQTAQIGTRSQQNHPRQQHQSGNEGSHRPAERIAYQPRTRECKAQLLVFLRVDLRQVCGD
jgi:hypothetical protein